MKKILVIFALLAISFTSINAQETSNGGATLGMNSSNFSGDAFSSKVGFHAGVKAGSGIATNCRRSIFGFRCPTVTKRCQG